LSTQVALVTVTVPEPLRVLKLTLVPMPPPLACALVVGSGLCEARVTRGCGVPGAVAGAEAGTDVAGLALALGCWLAEGPRNCQPSRPTISNPITTPARISPRPPEPLGRGGAVWTGGW
jgi:hypothetical protein